MAGAAGFEPASSGLEPDSLALSLRPQSITSFVKDPKENPPLMAGSGRNNTDSAPQDTFPQMTRLLVILVLACLSICVMSKPPYTRLRFFAN